MGHRYLAAVCCLLLLGSACSSANKSVDRTPDEAASLSGEPSSDGEDPSQKEPNPVSDGKKKGSGRTNPGTEKNPPKDRPADGEASDDKPSDGASDGPDEPRREDEKTTSFPASGTYLFAQEGYEEFCSGASCDRADLPARQKVSSTVTGRSAKGTEVLTEIDAKGDRVVRTSTLYSRSVAAVTSVYARFGYNGFVFENNYEPDPAVEILRFPLRTGDSWTGRWEADVSGTYRARVVGVETVTVGGRSIEAFKIETETTFRGEFEGTSDARIWVDPSTRVAVRTSGLLRLRMNFGGYNTAFQTDLISGPGY